MSKRFTITDGNPALKTRWWMVNKDGLLWPSYNKMSLWEAQRHPLSKPTKRIF